MQHLSNILGWYAKLKKAKLKKSVADKKTRVWDIYEIARNRYVMVSFMGFLRLFEDFEWKIWIENNWTHQLLDQWSQNENIRFFEFLIFAAPLMPA